MNTLIRPIQATDNTALAQIIRTSIEALHLPTEGTAHSDPTTDQLFQLFQTPDSYYYVVEHHGQVMGGCGIYPSKGLPSAYAELVRFFLDPTLRGKGIGRTLMELCESKAKDMGYTHLYLESFPDMEAAIHLYTQFGYIRINKALGNTGHFSCNVWMVKELR